MFEGKETAMPRLLLTSVVFALLALMAGTAAAADPAVGGSGLRSRFGGVGMNVDYRSLVSRADLDYNEPVSRSEEGMPVGNGRMGSLVWTTPTALKFQINRVDVFAQNCETNSFPVRDSDYGSGCGYVDIDFVDFGQDVFTGTAFRQHLSVYDALMTARGGGITVRVLAWPDPRSSRGDVMAVEVDDQRDQPSPVNIDLRMLRYAIQYHSGQNYNLTRSHSVMIRTCSHTVTSRLDIAYSAEAAAKAGRDARIILTQQFREGQYYNASAVAIGVVGREAKAKYANESTVRLSAAPGKGRFTILIASAAGFDPEDDIAVPALKELEAAAARGFEKLLADTAAWWHEFWSKGFVYMHSADGQADFVEQNYTYFLYLMGAGSRGDYPPRFGGMLWRTTGDMSRWGSQHWWANTSAYYSNLMPSNRLELMDPVFKMYFGMYDSCARAAVQQWGSKGIWIPETVWFDGLENLPEDIAAEMRDLYLVRKNWGQASARFLEYASTRQPHNSRWNWIGSGRWVDGRWVYRDKGRGPFGHTTHILGAGARIAALFWQRYQYTMDQTWLREHAYPMIKGAAEFYRNFPNFQKGEDGKYHIHHVNSGEGSWNSSDTSYEVSCMHMIFPLAIRVSQILGVDAELRPIWQEIKDNLVELPARARRDGAGAYGAFVYGGPGAITPLPPEENLKSRFLSFTRLGSFIDTAGIGGAQILRNRLRLREGPGAIDAEHIGGLASGIHETMLSSSGDPRLRGDRVPPAEAGVDGEPVLQIFNSWPKSWDAAFTLLARGGFVVSSSMEKGRIEFVQIQSQLGGECRLCNPWPDMAVTFYRDGKKPGDLSPDKSGILRFPTTRGETIVVVPKGTMPARKNVPQKL